MFFASTNAVNTKPKSSGLCPQSRDSQTAFTLCLYTCSKQKFESANHPGPQTVNKYFIFPQCSRTSLDMRGYFPVESPTTDT